jgi:hypothetical protein
MSQLSPSEAAKVRKVALHSVSITNEMKASVVDAKLKELAAEIKKQLIIKKNSIMVIAIKEQDNWA